MKWISIETELPLVTVQRVLVYSPYYGSDEVMYMRIIDAQFVARSIDVTHWMPLPEPPESRK